MSDLFSHLDGSTGSTFIYTLHITCNTFMDMNTTKQGHRLRKDARKIPPWSAKVLFVNENCNGKFKDIAF